MMLREPLLTESRSVQDFLKAVYGLQYEGNASTGAIAEALSIAPASVTDMAQRLYAAGLVNYQKHHGVSLTKAGNQLALRTIRCHRLIELYLAQDLGYKLYEVHREAEQ